MKKLIVTLSIVAITVFNLKSQTWIQRGTDIYGESADDQAGSSVKLSDNGNTLIVGSPLNDDGGTDAGEVTVYEWNGSAWIQKGNDLIGLNPGDQFGKSVDINQSGNIIVIGAPYFNGTGNDIGMVRAYEWNGTAWIQMGVDLVGGTSGLQDFFGISLDLTDHSRLAIGAPGGGTTVQGEVRVYEWDGTAWMQMGSSLVGDALNDNFGKSVALKNFDDYLVVGAPQNDGGGTNAGAVKVFLWNGTSWVQEGSTIYGTSVLDLFGHNVAISQFSAPVFMVNAPYGASGSYVKVFEWNAGINNWDQRGNNLPGCGFNQSTATTMSLGDVSNNRVAIGTATGGVSLSGICKFYYYNFITDVFDADYYFTDILGSNSFDYSGYSIGAVNAGAGGIAIGAHENDGNGSNSGQVRVFDFCYSTSSTITPTVQACSYTSPSGNYTYTASGLYTDTLMNVGGCDSIIEIDLTLTPPSSSITASSCFSYTVPSGNQTYTTNGIYNDTLPSSGGCDSIITISLTIEEVDLTVLNNGTYLQVNSLGISHQWLDCPALTPISGAVNSVFIPTTVGSYAVIITNLSGCVDTSACSFINVGLENLTNNHINIYPNPSDNFINISGLTSPANIQIVDALGKVIFTISSYTSSDLINIEKLISGLYFIQISEKDYLTTRTFIKK